MPFADVIDSCGHPTPRARVFLTLPPSPFQIEFIANTIIFVLAGLIIGNNFLALDDIGGKEWGYLVVLYIFVYLIRLTIVSLFYPLLMRLGYGLSMKEGAVVVHGGLRGAVGLALAIRVQEMSLQGYQDGLDYDLTKNDGNRILFFVGGIAVLTLLVQATTTEALMRRMGMFVLSMGTKRTSLGSRSTCMPPSVPSSAMIFSFTASPWPVVKNSTGSSFGDASSLPMKEAASRSSSQTSGISTASRAAEIQALS